MTPRSTASALLGLVFHSLLTQSLSFPSDALILSQLPDFIVEHDRNHVE